MPDVYRYGIFVPDGRFLPDLFVNLPDGEHLPGMLHEQPEHAVFDGRQGNRFSVHQNGFGPVVQLDSAVGQYIRRLVHTAEGGVPPQMGTHPGYQLHGIEGLGDVIVRSDVQPQNLVAGFAFGCEKQHRNVGVLPDFHRGGDSVHYRHHNVHQYQMHLFPGKDVQCFRPCVCRENSVSLRREIDFNGGNNIFFVVAD